MIAVELEFLRNQRWICPLTPRCVQQRRPRMSNPNQNPGQQNQNPGQKPGQQQGGGQKPGQQQQDPSRPGQTPNPQRDR
jgi:hypothetical protein